MSIDNHMLAALQRIEAKLDHLIEALAEEPDDEDTPAGSLDDPAAPPRGTPPASLS